MSVTGFLKQLFSGENDSVKASADSAVPAMTKHKANKAGNQLAENNDQNQSNQSNVKNHVKITKNEHEEVSHPIIKLT